MNLFFKSITWCAILTFAAILVAGCAKGTSPRALRISCNDDLSEFVGSVNGGSPHRDSFKGLTNFVESVSLRHSDVVLLETPRNLSPSDADRYFGWLVSLCATRKAALYIHPELESQEMVASPIYHWEAPTSDPRNRSQVVFYLEGKRLGDGHAGFEKLLASIKTAKPRSVFILGGWCDVDNSYSASESPYSKNRLKEVLSLVGTKELLPSKIP
jgi:hypothetical protein